MMRATAEVFALWVVFLYRFVKSTSRRDEGGPKYSLSFRATDPPVGYTVIFVDHPSEDGAGNLKRGRSNKRDDPDFCSKPSQSQTYTGDCLGEIRGLRGELWTDAVIGNPPLSVGYRRVWGTIITPRGLVSQDKPSQYCGVA